jgi:peptidoglycan hydrolase-like protein with peptidoglycan-binding domain
MGTNYRFRGCIINPSNPQPPTPPTPSGDPQIRYIQDTLNKHYNTGLVVDGIFGPATKKGITKALQLEDNKQYGAGLAVDGIMGPNTARRSPVIRKGANGWITWTIQCMLYCKGYDPGYLDGVYGSKMGSMLIAYQRDHGLVADGVVGYNTYMSLFS